MYSVEHMFSTLYTLHSVDYTMGCTLFNCMSTWFCQKGLVLDLQRKHFILRKAQPCEMYTCIHGIGVPMYMYMHTYTYDMQYIQHSFSWMGIHQHIPMSKRVSECMNECHFRENIVGLVYTCIHVKVARFMLDIVNTCFVAYRLITLILRTYLDMVVSLIPCLIPVRAGPWVSSMPVSKSITPATLRLASSESWDLECGRVIIMTMHHSMRM